MAWPEGRVPARSVPRSSSAAQAGLCQRIIRGLGEGGRRRNLSFKDRSLLLVMTPPPQERAAMASGCAADNCRRHPSQGSQGGSLGQAPCTWRRSLRQQPPVCACADKLGRGRVR